MRPRVPYLNTARTQQKERNKNLFSSELLRGGLFLRSRCISLLLLVFDFTTTIQTTIDTDDAQEERETTGITRQKERAD